MIYLVISGRGYYLSMSKAAAEAKCKYLIVAKCSIITCTCFEEAVQCIKMYREGFEADSMELGKLTFWNPLLSIVLVDIPAGESYHCRSDGTVTWKRQNGNQEVYKISVDGHLDSKKSVRLLKKHGSLVFYDFLNKMPMLIYANGKIAVNTGESLDSGT